MSDSPTDSYNDDLKIQPAPPRRPFKVPQIVVDAILRLGLTDLNDPELKPVRKIIRTQEDLDILIVHSGRVMRDAEEAYEEAGFDMSGLMDEDIGPADFAKKIEKVHWYIEYQEHVRQNFLRFFVDFVKD